MNTTLKPKLPCQTEALRRLVCLALVLCGGLVGCSTDSNRAGNEPGDSTGSWQTKTIASEADLDRVIGQLQNPATRFDAFQALLEFAGYPKGNINSEDLKVNTLHEKAINAMQACPGLDAIIDTMIAGLKDPDKRIPMIKALLRLTDGFGGMQGYTPSTPLERLMSRANGAAQGAFDVPTVEKALRDPDWLLRITAVEHFGNPPADINQWKHLLPQMEKIAADDDPAIRSAANEKLQEFPETEKFLDERLTNEISPSVIMELLRDRNVGNELDNRFLALFVPLLSNPGEKVREDALWFVSGNPYRAPILQFPFGMDVYNQVITSTRSKSADERAAAASALTAIRSLNPDRSRETFLRLANDPDEAVRQQVAWGLAGEFDRKDVMRAITSLLKDKSPGVRFMTILAFGAEKCIPELEELSKGSDPLIANLAADKLKQLANNTSNGTNRAQVKLKFVSADSEETNSDYGYGRNAVDGDPNTYWHTQWHGNSPGLPHEIVIELVPPSVIKGFAYLPRQDESDHGTIKDYEFYVSNDGKYFGQPVKRGEFGPGKDEKVETFNPIKCRFIKLKALSEINGLPWTSAAEIRVIEIGEDASPKDYWHGNGRPVDWHLPTSQVSTKPDGTGQNLTKQISDTLIECQKIKPGMTRVELLKVFTIEGGLSTAKHQTFVNRTCPYIKVDVGFETSITQQKLVIAQPTDIIRTISKPYLDWPIAD